MPFLLFNVTRPPPSVWFGRANPTVPCSFFARFSAHPGVRGAAAALVELIVIPERSRQKSGECVSALALSGREERRLLFKLHFPSGCLLF